MALIFSSSGESGAASHTLALLQYTNELLRLSLSPGTLILLNFALRKTAHFSVYLVLGLLIYRALAGGLTRFTLRFACWTAALGLLYALTDEFHQAFVSTRTASLYDVGLDFTGVVVSLVFPLLRSRFVARLAHQPHANVSPEATSVVVPSTQSEDSTTTVA